MKKWEHDVYHAGEERTCPYCGEEEKLSFFEGEPCDTIIDYDRICVDWDTRCEKCGRNFVLREVFNLAYSRITYED